MKKIVCLVFVAIVGFVFISCDTGSGNDGGASTPTVSDGDGSVYESFSYDIGTFQVGYAANWANGTDGSDDAKANMTLAYDSDEGAGSMAAQITWSNSDSFSGQIYATHYTNSDPVDISGTTMVVKIKCPDGFIDGYDPDPDTADDEIYPGLKLYVKGTDWTESSMWFGAWNIKDALDGNDQSASGIIADTEDGYVLLKAVVDTDITPDDSTQMYEGGVVFEQNSDETLTDDMVFYIDYIDFE